MLYSTLCAFDSRVFLRFSLSRAKDAHTNRSQTSMTGIIADTGRFGCGDPYRCAIPECALILSSNRAAGNDFLSTRFRDGAECQTLALLQNGKRSRQKRDHSLPGCIGAVVVPARRTSAASLQAPRSQAEDQRNCYGQCRSFHPSPFRIVLFRSLLFR